MLFKYCLVWSVRLEKKKKNPPPGALCCCFACPHGAITYPKTPAFSTTEIGKIWDLCASTKRSQKSRQMFVCFFLFFPFACKHCCYKACARYKKAVTGSSRLGLKCDLAQRHWQKPIGTLQGTAVRGVPRLAGVPTEREGGGSMTGTLASRCRLGDNAALINFLFSCHNDRRR